jgi:hypothetical protein
MVNGRPILRAGDEGVDPKGTWHVVEGARYVLVNNREVARRGDRTDHERAGTLVTGSSFVLVGEIESPPRERTESAVAVRVFDHKGRPVRSAALHFKKEGPGYVAASVTDGHGRAVAWRQEGDGYQPRMEGWILVRKVK